MLPRSAQPSTFHPLQRQGNTLLVLDQSQLPFEEVWVQLDTWSGACRAISDMQVRGAPLIGVVAAYGLALALTQDPSDAHLAHARSALAGTRPTAVNLHWALSRLYDRLAPLPPSARGDAAWHEADCIYHEDIACNRAIGEQGLALLRSLHEASGATLNILTHCNAGVLATAGWGTALAPVYLAHVAGVPVHVWVSETRPRNQGLLTAWELGRLGVPHTLVADNAAGHLLFRGAVDAVIVGADRIAANGDVANKIGTVLKALAARHAGVPFYVAAPTSTFDLECPTGDDIPIEKRSGEELRVVAGRQGGAVHTVRCVDHTVAADNPAFDVTPAGWVTAVITECGTLTPGAVPPRFSPAV